MFLGPKAILLKTGYGGGSGRIDSFAGNDGLNNREYALV
jgi:hypothetical protein